MVIINYSDLRDAVILKYEALASAIIDLELRIVVVENDRQYEFQTQEAFLTFLRNRGLIANEQI